ncbi:hypothetical protein BKD02_08805 [Brucella sp. 09RB8910]|nr:hypothetical protein BKD02_08805 [Brucella sp. 09RB8910]
MVVFFQKQRLHQPHTSSKSVYKRNTSAILAIIRPMAIPSYTFTSLGIRTANRTDQSRVPTRVTRVPWLDGEMAIKCLQNPF